MNEYQLRLKIQWYKELLNKLSGNEKSIYVQAIKKKLKALYKEAEEQGIKI